jgi:hypothetical protein
MIRMHHSTQQRRKGCDVAGLRSSWLARFVVGLMLCCGPVRPVDLRAAAYSVPQVQAVFLFNFAQFVKWPAKAFPDAGSPMTIGVLGANPFGGALDNTVRGETVAGRRMAVKYSRRAEDLKGCQIVFVSKSEAGRIGSILKTYQGSPILMVSDIPRFCEQGGMIHFIIEGGRVKFSINSQSAKNADLQVSSKLLRLAK